jgi:hypothetical protein
MPQPIFNRRGTEKILRHGWLLMNTDKRQSLAQLAHWKLQHLK